METDSYSSNLDQSSSAKSNINSPNLNSQGQWELPLSATQSVKRTKQVSRDEMNLAEFPLTVLSTRVNPKVKTLEFQDTIKGKDGKLVKREWVITGADKFGLPTATDDEVLLGLLKLTVDDGLENQKVYFTRYELLKILKWSTEGRSYNRLQNAFDRLSGVRIKAKNAFYDNESKAHNTKNFGIIDAYEINDGRDTKPKPSFFIWSEELFKSFQVGFIKKIDLNFFLELRSAVSKRLYRYLDKHFWYKSRISINLFTLAHEKIGISRNYKYASSLKQQLEPALEELIDLGFLSKVEFEGRGKACQIIFYAGSGKPRVLQKSEGPTTSTQSEVQSFELQPELQSLVDALTSRGLTKAQSVRLLGGHEESALKRVDKIIKHFDQLVASASPLVSKSPVGFLYRAVENPQKFVLPEDQKGAPAQSRPQGQATQSMHSSRIQIQKELYYKWRQSELNKLRQEVEPEMLTRMRAEIDQSLQSIKNNVSAQRFAETVAQRVDDRLVDLFAIPSFEEWIGEIAGS